VWPKELGLTAVSEARARALTRARVLRAQRRRARKATPPGDAAAALTATDARQRRRRPRSAACGFTAARTAADGRWRRLKESPAGKEGGESAPGPNRELSLRVLSPLFS